MTVIERALDQELAHRVLQIRRNRDRQLAIRPIDCQALASSGSLPAYYYKELGILNNRQIDLIELDVVSLAREIRERRLTCEEVMEAYITSACLAQAGTNCLTWLLAEEAIERAKFLDRMVEDTGKVVGPLHGVPMSVKDFISIRGIPQSAGHISGAGHVPDEDAAMIAIFRRAGAVFFAKTTQPQSIMHLETSSHLYGTTCSAYNTGLTSGGSSGGEGALVGCHGSPWGITTDVGGSTRSPAANNGLWGFKPSTKRVPKGGIIGITSVSRIAGTPGPVCHSLRDLELFFEVLYDNTPWLDDVHLINLDWRHVGQNGKGLGYAGWQGVGGNLRIGVMREDGVVRPVRPIRRAIEQMVDALALSGGAEIVEFSPTDWSAAWELTAALYYTDGGAKLREALGNEPMLTLTQYITEGRQALSLQELETLIGRRNALREKTLLQFRELRIDVLLCPVGPAPAQPIGTTKYWNYTSFWNLIDWPAAVFPTGLRVTPDDTETFPQPRNEQEKHLYSTYSVNIAQGSPIGLQVVAPRWEDERLMAALKSMAKVLPLQR